MEYKFASYKLFDVDFAVIAVSQDEVVTTTSMLATALEVDQKVIRKNYENHKELFNPLRVNTYGVRAKEVSELIQQHKEALGVKRVREELLLWTEEDMYTHCQLSRSPKAVQFMRYNMRHLKEWRRANIALSTVSQEQFRRMANENEQTKAQLEELKEYVYQILGPLNKQASAAGQSLSLHKYTKAFRNLTN